MSKNNSTASIWSDPGRDLVRVVAPPLLPTQPNEAEVHHRHGLVPGLTQAALTSTRVAVIGVGAAGSELARVLARKGVGFLSIFDPDPAVELSNLPRQFYYYSQIHSPKALVLPHNLARESTGAATIEGHFLAFEEAVEQGCDVACDIAVVAVDSNRTRAFCSRHFREHRIPCIFTGFALNADRAYVFVQETTGPCWGCVFPDQARDDHRFPCTGGTIELPAITAGLIAYAIDSLLMARQRYWNYRELSLSGAVADVASRIAIRIDCPLCSGTGA